ncbi:MAG TPA: PVC-type heme-binding CxxCH protein [Chryseolinea sp.]|nr:PVC-type heme-binding CxxCH protein [Chryseolinea sp.]
MEKRGNKCILLIALACISGGSFILLNCDSGPEKKFRAEASLTSFEIEEGFKIELIASEPLIGDPVDMEIDEHGRLYVVEMPGYPLDKSGSGKIKILADTNGDGRMDKSITFAENLILPNSVMRWKKGLLVTDAPNVLYFEDTDDDGKSDIRDTLLTGFALSNPQHNLNSPLLGIDNWIYLAHEGAVSTETYQQEFGDAGREIYFPDYPAAPRLSKNANGRAVRFRPDTRQLEVLSSHTQFGHTFDRWGHYLQVGNANHIYHEIIPESYLARNPNLLLSNSTQSISDHGSAAEVFPITQNPQHQLLTDVGVITSACGITAYLGGAFRVPYDNDVTFVAEPVSNLIHVDKLKPDGATFIASRTKPHQEFLASTDPKFRPVNLYTGPDGALYVVDYYRQIIEHPEWMGEEVIASGELYNDTDKGRIYRISAKEAKRAEWMSGLDLATATDESLIMRLADSNGWWRQNAQRLLIDRRRKTSVGPLDAMANNTSPMGRLHALWTLEGLGELKSQQIAAALQDKEAGIRENAIKLAELHLSDSPELENALIGLQSDPDARVRFQLLCTLGSLHSVAADQARQHLLFHDIDDKWVQAAALSASSNPNTLLDIVIEKFREDKPSHRTFLERLVAMMASSGQQETLEELMTIVKKQYRPAVQAAVFEGISQGLQHKKRIIISEADQAMLARVFFETEVPAVRKGALHMLQAMTSKNEPIISQSIIRAAKIATDRTLSEDKRADAIDLISVGNPANYYDLLKELFVSQEPLTVQLAALRSLSAIPDVSVSHYLLERWNVLTPQVQDAAISTFLTGDERIGILLNAIEANKILPSSISWPRKVRLMAQRNEALRNRSRAIFTASNESDVTKAYQSALQLKGDIESGKMIYQQNCALCHQIRGTMGVAIGPDLGTVHNWSAVAIMANTLEPNLSISSGFDLWALELNNGESIQGIIASETPGAITLRNTGTTDKTINRRDIKSLKALNMSIMPGGLGKQIDQQQMADLLAFLKHNK